MALVNKSVQLTPWERMFSRKHLWCGDTLLLIQYPVFKTMLLADAWFCPLSVKDLCSLKAFVTVLHEKQKCWGLVSIPHVTSTLAVSLALFLIFHVSSTQQTHFFFYVHTYFFQPAIWVSPSLSASIRAVHMLAGTGARYMRWDGPTCCCQADWEVVEL